MKNTIQAWSNYYEELKGSNNYFPENFVLRIFLSKRPIQFIEHDYENKSLLDLGCGHGRHIPFLTNLGLKVSGLEVNNEQVKKLKSTFPDNQFLLGSAANIPISDQNFDFILASNSVYYLQNSESSFTDHLISCHKALKPKGYFIFTMLDKNHSIFKDAKSIDNSKFEIQNDFMGFRNGVIIKAYDAIDLETSLKGLFSIKYKGECIEKVNDHNRHFHYFVAKKI